MENVWIINTVLYSGLCIGSIALTIWLARILWKWLKEEIIDIGRQIKK